MPVQEVFYQFVPGQVPALDPWLAQAAGLAVAPSPSDLEAFGVQCRHPGYAALRRSLQHPPDTVAALREEAQEYLEQKVLPRHGLAPSAAAQLPEGRQTRVHEGHVSWPARPGVEQLRRGLSETFAHDCQLLGDFLYPPGGFRRWHSNKYDLTRDAVWTLFFVQASAADASYFRYVDPFTGELVTAWDRPVCANVFRVSYEPVMWHCIGSDTTMRWSQGFDLPDDWRERLGL